MKMNSQYAPLITNRGSDRTSLPKRTRESRSALIKKLAQKAWGQEESKYAKRRLNQKTQNKKKKSRARPTRQILMEIDDGDDDNDGEEEESERTTIDEEAIPFVMEEGEGTSQHFDEGYSTRDYGAGFSDDDDEDDADIEWQSHYDVVDDDDDEIVKGHHRAVLPRSEYHIYSTEMGDKFRVRPSRMTQQLPESTMKLPQIGLGRRQHTLRMEPPEHPGGRVEWEPITEDGYLNPEDREDPSVIPYSVEYVDQLLERQDVIRSHPDYEFLSQFASHLSLFPEDVLVEESVSRKQAAASTALSALSARRQALAFELENFGRRIERLRADRINKETRLENRTRGLLSSDRSDGKQLLSEYGREREAALNARRFSAFLTILKMMMDTNVQSSEITGDDNVLETVSYYLRILSPNTSSDMTQRILSHFSKNKDHPQVGSSVRLSFFLYAVADFIASLGATFSRGLIPSVKQETVEAGGLDTSFDFDPTTLGLFIPGPGGPGWRPINITIVPEGQNTSDPDIVGDFGKVPKPGARKDEFDADILAFMFEPSENHTDVLEVLRAIRSGGYIADPERIDTSAKQSRYANALQSQYRALRDMFIEDELYGEDPSTGIATSIFTITDEMNTSAQVSITSLEAQKIRTAESILIYLSRNSLKTSLSYYGLLDDVTHYNTQYAINNGVITDPEGVVDILRRWVSSLATDEKRLRGEIQTIDLAITDINTRIEALRRTGTGPGEPEISVPFRTTLEWALKSFNTGRIEVAPWALAAINAGHAAFKRYAGRKNPAWAKIERNVIQRDELMSPLFSEFCATYVNKAKIANPRRYMHASASRELMMRRASILKEMLDDLLYNQSTKKFSLKR